MSRSPRRKAAADWGALTREVQRKTHFQVGKNHLVTDDDLGRVGTLAERLFGAKARMCGVCDGGGVGANGCAGARGREFWFYCRD